ncbi:MAG: TerB family tellurite resistance protein [Proteobacteria bacterium]|nr:TerB family tellurite resistance protein [Pseudomonadota bacterium]
MFDLIKKVLGNKQGRITVSEAESLDRTQLAACVVLLEAAYADFECTDEELDHVMQTLQAEFGVSKEYAQELLDMAHQERSKAIDLWQFTNRINQEFSKDEKRAVLEGVWRIIYADGELEKHEDQFVRKLTNLLRLSHKDMIDAKLRTRAQIQ